MTKYPGSGAIQQMQTNVYKTQIDPVNVQILPVEENCDTIAAIAGMIFKEFRPKYFWKKPCLAAKGAGNSNSLVAEARISISQIE